MTEDECAEAMRKLYKRKFGVITGIDTSKFKNGRPLFLEEGGQITQKRPRKRFRVMIVDFAKRLLRKELTP